MNVTAASRPTSVLHIAARTQTATIQITVNAKRNLAAVANLASNILSQAGRLTLLYCTRFVFASLHSFRICFIALDLFFLHAFCKISTNNIINNKKGSHENRLAYDCPGNVIKLNINKTMSISKHIFEIYIDWLIDTWWQAGQLLRSNGEGGVVKSCNLKLSNGDPLVPWLRVVLKHLVRRASSIINSDFVTESLCQYSKDLAWLL